jgi:O-succinylbenzoate synthase
VISAVQVHASRTHLFLEVEIDDVRGLGEISPQPVAVNGDPGVEEVVAELEHFVVRQFLDATTREGTPPAWTRVTHFAGSRRASRTASALLEMALLDAHLRSRRATIAHQWPARFATPRQATVSLLGDDAWARPDGATRLRAKVSTNPVPVDAWRRLAQWGLPVVLDFNCSAHHVDDVVAATAVATRYLDVAAVEQPFAPGNVVEHARLAAALDVPVSMDEGVRHRRDLDQIHRYGAARMICVKPARVGGFVQARAMIEHAQQLGLEVYLGGFFESELARRANRALANHYVTQPSDIGPVALRTHDLVLSDPWGCGLVPGPGLAAAAPVMTWTR